MSESDSDATTDGAATDVETAVSYRSRKAARAFGWALAAVLLAGWAALFLLPSDPRSDGPEAGFLQDLLAHDLAAADLIAEVRAADPDSDEAMLLDRVAKVLSDDEEAAAAALNRWDIDPERSAPAMSWMGHVVPGSTPGQISDADIASLSHDGSAQQLSSALALLFGHLRGSVLMSRGLLALSSHPETIALVERSVEERIGLIEEVETVFVDRGELPPTWLAPMTTDPGNLDHGDPVGSLGDVVSDALVWIPLAAGLVFAVVAASGSIALPRPVVGLAVLAGFFAGVGHLALAAPHGDDSLASAVFFVAVGMVQIATAAALLARPSPVLLNVAATIAMGLIGVYVLFRVYPPPGSVGPSDVDLAGIVLVGLQLVVVASWALRPLGGEVGVWGADALLDVAINGASTSVLVALLAVAGFAGYVVGETDSRAPSQTDVGFALDMSTHHSQAVQLSQIVDGRLSNAGVDVFRREVPIFQQYEVGIMHTRLEEWGQLRSGDGLVMGWMGMEMPTEEMPGIVSQAQLDVLASAEGTELDEMFLALLSAHHVGGIQMAAFAAENADDASLAELAGRIARNQRIEIFEYTQLMDRLGYQTPPGSMTMTDLADVAAIAIDSQ